MSIVIQLLPTSFTKNTSRCPSKSTISILRLDGDLYESTLIPLKFLYDKVVDGGIIIIDDWNLDGCKKAVKKFIHHKKIKMFNEIAYVIK